MTWMWIDDVRRDVAFAVRILRRTPGFTPVAVLTLAIGIGINAAVFTVTNAVLSKASRSSSATTAGLHDVGRDAACRIRTSRTGEPRRRRSRRWRWFMASGDAERWQRLSRAAGRDRSHRQHLRLVGQRPISAATSRRADEQPGRAPVVLLRHELWERRFGEDPDIVGRTMRLNGRAATVIGVMPRGFSFPAEPGSLDAAGSDGRGRGGGKSGTPGSSSAG